MHLVSSDRARQEPMPYSSDALNAARLSARTVWKTFFLSASGIQAPISQEQAYYLTGGLVRDTGLSNVWLDGYISLLSGRERQPKQTPVVLPSARALIPAAGLEQASEDAVSTIEMTHALLGETPQDESDQQTLAGTLTRQELIVGIGIGWLCTRIDPNFPHRNVPRHFERFMTYIRPYAPRQS